MTIFDTGALYLIIETLGWALLHFLWQGALLALVFFLAMAAMKDAAPRSRYRCGLALFVLAAAAPVITFILLFEPVRATPAVEPLAALVIEAGGASTVSLWLQWEQMLTPYLPWAVALWLAGVVLMSARVSWDWLTVRRLVHTRVSTPPMSLRTQAEALARRLNVARRVRVLCSEVVRVPAVVGWLKPVILLPTAALIQLEQRQLELIIAHELAHIRRADYLVNLFQVMVETLLFYHPAVRWMSERLRAERELCCDDEVVQACGDPLIYAKALAELESQRSSGMQTALAASGGHLSQRIHRMLERPVPRHGAVVWGAGLLVGVAVCSVALAAQLTFTPAPPAAPVAPAPGAPMIDPDPAPAARLMNESPGAPVTVPAPAATPVIAPAAPANGETPVKRVETAPQPVIRQASELPEPPATIKPVELVTESITEPASDPAAAPLQLPEPQTVRLPESTDGTPEAASPAPLIIAKRRAPTPITLEPETASITGGEPLQLVAPHYPRRARVRGQEGEVVAEFTIDKEGRVGAIEIVKSKPAGTFDTAVKQALDGWLFEPLIKNGEVVARRVSKSFVFSLKHGITSSDNGCDPVTGTRICQ